ncbi:hypothetical protein S245_007331, partial [Arachis hypogaea]
MEVAGFGWCVSWRMPTRLTLLDLEQRDEYNDMHLQMVHAKGGVGHIQLETMLLQFEGLIVKG